MVVAMGAVRGAVRHRAGLQPAYTRTLWRVGPALDRGKLRAADRFAVRHDSPALVRGGGRGDGDLPGARIPAGAFHFALRAPQEPLPAARHAALLDEFPGAHLRLAFPAARYGAD